MPTKAHIVSLGTYLPEKVLSNADLEKIVETSDEWIYSRTGIKERRMASKDEPTSYMAIEAAKAAIEKAGIDPNQIDLILLATVTPDYLGSNTASLVQTGLGLSHIPAVDLQAACSGFIYGLSMAKAYIESHMYKNILFIASEKMTSFVDFTDRNTCILFGDGACAAIITGENKGLAIENVCLGADGANMDLVYVPAGGVHMPATHETIEARDHYFKLKGREVYKNAVRRMGVIMLECMEKTGLSKEQIAWLIPHQANLRIIESLANSLEMPMERVYLTIEKYGNTSASSVGIALTELVETTPIQAGEHLLLTAFGAGLTWGAAILTQEKE